MKEKFYESLGKTGHIAADQQGFDSVHDFMQSVFHIHQFSKIFSATSILTVTATIIEKYVGLKPIVLFAILSLFFLEMLTGIYYARLNKQYSSKRSPRGFIKLAVYMFLIASSYIFAKNVEIMHIPGLDVDLNFYLVLHYLFLNFTIINLFTSIIENCVKLGWEEHLPILKKLHSFLKLEDPKKKKNESEKL